MTNLKVFALIFFLINFTSKGQNDTLLLKAYSTIIPSSREMQVAVKFLREYPNEVILLSCNQCDSVLFAKVNSYRISMGLQSLKASVRLDTLGDKMLLYLHKYEDTKHYSSIKEMQPYADLMNIENISYSHSLGSPTFTYDIDAVLRGWIKSKRHNENLLSETEVGSISSMTKLSMIDNIMIIEVFTVFESDYAESKRENAKKVDEINKRLIKRPMKFQRLKPN